MTCLTAARRRTFAATDPNKSTRKEVRPILRILWARVLRTRMPLTTG